MRRMELVNNDAFFTLLLQKYAPNRRSIRFDRKDSGDGKAPKT